MKDEDRSIWLERLILTGCFGFIFWWLQNQWQSFADFKDYLNQNVVTHEELDSHRNLGGHPAMGERVSTLEAILPLILDDLKEIKSGQGVIRRDQGLIKSDIRKALSEEERK